MVLFKLFIENVEREKNRAAYSYSLVNAFSSMIKDDFITFAIQK